MADLKSALESALPEVAAASSFPSFVTSANGAPLSLEMLSGPFGSACCTWKRPCMIPTSGTNWLLLCSTKRMSRSPTLNFGASVTFDQLVGDAELIFQGTVTDVRSQWIGEGAERAVVSFI